MFRLWPRVSTAQTEQTRLILESSRFRLHITSQTFQVLVRQRFNGWIFRFANPRNFDFHGKDLTTEGTKDTEKPARLNLESEIYNLKFLRGPRSLRQDYARFFLTLRTGARRAVTRAAASSAGSIRLADFHNRSRS